MMKGILKFALKFVAICMAIAAVTCCVVAYWDRITAFLGCAKAKLAEKKSCCCHTSEYDDYADWDEG